MTYSSNENIISVLKKEIPKISEEDLCAPIRNTHIDSLDLVVIRVALEKYFDINISDIIWYNFQTLAESLDYFQNNTHYFTATSKSEEENIFYTENIEIRMPQMANSALSENWLLKYIGDTHWELISKGFNKKSTDFQDEIGNRLYATFIRINYKISPLNLFYENEIIDFNSSIKAYGNNSFISEINGICSNKEISATLMTTFSIRENENNNKISKCQPNVLTNKIIKLSNTPVFINEYRLLKKGLIDEISTCFGNFHITDNVLFSCEYEINPFYDINGVGLLYFAAYPIIADKCFLKYRAKSIDFQTIYRDIFYFANCNLTEKIIYKLNSIVESETQIKALMTLFRASDNQMLATILTVKQLN
jgi:probable biosynthetic protein (TIGR04098 family)